METKRLVHMANQIAHFFEAYPEADAIAAVESHIRQFWDPRMRESLLAHVATGGDGLSKIARAAAQKLQDRAAVP
jgi:formate dehydrogenase subunit delta